VVLSEAFVTLAQMTTVCIHSQLTHVNQLTSNLSYRIGYDRNPRHRSYYFPQEDSIQIPRGARRFRMSFLFLSFPSSFCALGRLVKSKVFGVPATTPVSLAGFFDIPCILNRLLGELRDRGANVTLMIQSDMLAYHVPGERAQLAFPET